MSIIPAELQNLLPKFPLVGYTGPKDLELLE